MYHYTIHHIYIHKIVFIIICLSSKSRDQGKKQSHCDTLLALGILLPITSKMIKGASKFAALYLFFLYTQYFNKSCFYLRVMGDTLRVILMCHAVNQVGKLLRSVVLTLFSFLVFFSNQRPHIFYLLHRTPLSKRNTKRLTKKKELKTNIRKIEQNYN